MNKRDDLSFGGAEEAEIREPIKDLEETSVEEVNEMFEALREKDAKIEEQEALIEQQTLEAEDSKEEAKILKDEITAIRIDRIKQGFSLLDENFKPNSPKKPLFISLFNELADNLPEGYVKD